MNQKRVLLLMTFLALMLPIVSFLGQQNQENRNLAYSQLGQSCKLTSACQPPLVCSSGICKRGPTRTGDQKLNESCNGESDCVSPYVCYSGRCKVRSGGECTRSGDCYSNHYCSRSNHHCRKIDEYNIDDYSVEGVSVRSMLGRENLTPAPATRPTTGFDPSDQTCSSISCSSCSTAKLCWDNGCWWDGLCIPIPTPTSKPTTVPTTKPTSKSTTVPTTKPTSKPTTVPTTKPTSKPTTVPTTKPTTVPTRIPTIIPTKIPTISLLETKISFKIAFLGIIPGAKCINEFLIPNTKLELDVNNIPSNIFEVGITTSFEETNEIDVKGNRIFKVTNLILDKNKFSSVDNYNYIKIKGPWHLKRKMCLEGQNGKLPEYTICNINLTSDNVYDFSKYILLAGDINLDGTINSGDLSYIKSQLNAGAEVNCGIEGDLNMDGVVNTGDLNLAKDSLLEREDE